MNIVCFAAGERWYLGSPPLVIRITRFSRHSWAGHQLLSCRHLQLPSDGEHGTPSLTHDVELAGGGNGQPPPGSDRGHCREFAAQIEEESGFGFCVSVIVPRPNGNGNEKGDSDVAYNA